MHGQQHTQLLRLHMPEGLPSQHRSCRENITHTHKCLLPNCVIKAIRHISRLGIVEEKETTKTIFLFLTLSLALWVNLFLLIVGIFLFVIYRVGVSMKRLPSLHKMTTHTATNHFPTSDLHCKHYWSHYLTHIKGCLLKGSVDY